MDILNRKYAPFCGVKPYGTAQSEVGTARFFSNSIRGYRTPSSTAAGWAVAKNPEVLLCDEPTGILDSKTGIMVLKALQEVNRSLGTDTVLITHNVVIGGMADRIISLHDGKISGIEHNETKISSDRMEW